MTKQAEDETAGRVLNITPSIIVVSRQVLVDGIMVDKQKTHAESLVALARMTERAEVAGNARVAFVGVATVVTQRVRQRAVKYVRRRQVVAVFATLVTTS